MADGADGGWAVGHLLRAWNIWEPAKLAEVSQPSKLYRLRCWRKLMEFDDFQWLMKHQRTFPRTLRERLGESGAQRKVQPPPPNGEGLGYGAPLYSRWFHSAKKHPGYEECNGNTSAYGYKV